MANRRLDPESAEDTVRWERSRFALLETVVLTAAIPLIGWAINRQDPFFQSSPFPWLVFAPLFAGLLTGALLGLVMGWIAATLVCGVLIAAMIAVLFDRSREQLGHRQRRKFLVPGAGVRIALAPGL